MQFWLNMGLRLLFPAASVEAESTVTSLLDDDGDRKPTSMLVVGNNMVTVLAPAGACYLAGYCGQGSFALGNFNQLNLLPLAIKQEHRARGTVPVKSLLV